MAEQVYEMFAKLGLEHSGMMSGLAAVSTKLIGLSTQIKDVQLLFKGLGSMFIGFVLLDQLENLMVKTSKLNEELTRLKLQGGPMEAFVDSGRGKTLAFEVAQKVKGMKVEDIAKIIGPIYSIFGEEGIEKGMPEITARAQTVLQFQKGYKGDPEKDMAALIRAGEASGRFTDATTGMIDPEKVKAFYDMAIQIISATHGMVDAQQLLGLAKQGGFSLRGMSNEGFMTEAIMAQVLGGQRVGTATLGIYQQLAQGKMTGKTARGMEAVGLLGANEYEIGKMGTVTIDKEAMQRLSKQFTDDPMKLTQQIMDNLTKMGITDPGERLRLVSNAFGRQTTQRYEGEMAANMNQMLSERGRAQTAEGMDKASETINNQSITFNLLAMHDAWDNLMTAIAGPNSETFIKILQNITSALQSMTTAVLGMDPKTLQFIGEGLVTLAGALMLGGMVAVIAAIGTGGWLIVAFTALAAINWDKLEGIAHFVQTMSGILRKIDEWSSITIPPWMQWNGPKPDAVPNPSLQDGLKSLNRFEGVGPTGPRVIPANFTPGEKKQVLQPITLAINVDGHMLAQAVSEVLEDLYEHPTGPPDANGVDHFRYPGGQDST
jgi:hypothetical protein